MPNPEAVDAEIIPKDPEMPESIVHKMYIRKADIIKYVETPGCIGCRCVFLGKSLQSHTSACRGRIEGDLGEGDQPESISRSLPDDGRGQKISSDNVGDVADQRESISRGFPDDDEKPVPAGIPQPHSKDLAGAVAKSEKKKVKWNLCVEIIN